MKSILHWAYALAAIANCLVVPQLSANATERLPNIVILLSDDLGFGELQCLNPDRGKIPTPCMDEIARSGMIFTNAHGGSSVCTPTRYGLLTGRYAWRTRLQAGVLTGGESLIAEDRLTLAKLLREHGYHTAAIGKWHLGMLFDGVENAGDVAIGSRVSEGPLDRGGFDEFHGFHHARQIETWIDNDLVTERVSSIDVLPKLTRAAVDYIHSRQGQQQPFFLYVPWSSPHSPVVPSLTWQGKSGLNAHADFVMQTDDSCGQVMQALKQAGFLDNTLVICTSDNGTSAPTANMAQLQSLGHYPSGALRGSKADIWEGGHRVPFLVSWPSVVTPSSRTDSLICFTDLLATIAEIVGVSLPDESAEDSISFLSKLHGLSTDARNQIVHHSVDGYFAVRQDQWKLVLCPGSGGWTEPKPTLDTWNQVRDAGLPLVQLYDLSQDLSEQNNLAAQYPDMVAELRALLDQFVDRGRSTPGEIQQNDVAVVIDKSPSK